MKRERKILPYTNKFGDVINPGDTVYAITTCTKQTCINKGEYIGYVERDGYDYKTKSYVKMPFVQVKVPAERTEYFDTLKNKKYDWAGYTKEYFAEHVERRDIAYDRITTLQYNNILPSNTSVETLAKAV